MLVQFFKEWCMIPAETVIAEYCGIVTLSQTGNFSRIIRCILWWHMGNYLMYIMMTHGQEWISTGIHFFCASACASLAAVQQVLMTSVKETNTRITILAEIGAPSSLLSCFQQWLIPDVTKEVSRKPSVVPIVTFFLLLLGRGWFAYRSRRVYKSFKIVRGFCLHCGPIKYGKKAFRVFHSSLTMSRTMYDKNYIGLNLTGE